jgi:O-antigen/teichoic acid export membrane protein
MIDNKNSILKINAITSTVQVGLSSVILFVLYQYIIRKLGVEILGIWSVVISMTNIINIANFGFSGSVVKFLAKYISNNEKEKAIQLVETAVVTTVFFATSLILLSFPLINYILKRIFKPYFHDVVSPILPIVLLSFVILMVADVIKSGLDGCERIYARNILLVTNYSLFLLFNILLIPKLGVKGLAYAQLIQSITLFIGGVILLKRYLKGLSFIPHKWNKAVFLEIYKYGLNFQIMSVTQLFCDPVTRFLMVKYGGASLAGYYEMANRLLQQIRSLIVSANQSIVPRIASIYESYQDTINDIYKKNIHFIIHVSIPLYAFVISCIPFISEVWIGHYEKDFVIAAVLLSINLFINIISVPAYFCYLGIGILKHNVYSFTLNAILNLILGLILGYFYGGIAVIVAWVVSSTAGSIYILASYHVLNNINFKEIFSKQVILMAIKYLLITSIVFMSYYYINNTLFKVLSLSLYFIYIAIENRSYVCDLLQYKKRLFQRG